MHIKCSQRACAQLTLPPARLQELVSRAMDAFTELNLNRFGDDEGGGVILNEKAYSGQHVMAVLIQAQEAQGLLLSERAGQR
eukprot:3007372-Pleurochrysis_carterae.AAC.1